MQALVLEKIAPITQSPLLYTDIADPKPGPQELLVQVKACGICRTDLHIIEGELPQQRLPLVPGHQVVGTVVSCGPRCTRFAPGERVGIAWLRHTCGSCSFCTNNAENLCPHSRYSGYHEHGGFAEYTVIDENYAYHIPDQFADEEAAPLLCAGIIGYRSLKRSTLAAGGKLAIFGFGSSAHITFQIAKYWECEVFVATRGESHQQLAKMMGAHWVGEIDDALPTKVDSAIVFAPRGDIVPYALQALKPGGTVSLAGIHMSAVPELDYKSHLFHEKTLTSVEANTREDGEELLSLAASIPIKPRLTTFPLREGNRALQMLKDGVIEGTGVLMVT